MGSPKLSDADIEKAVKLLDGWQGKLTWNFYIALLAVELHHTYTKQALHKQPRINAAWRLAKARIASNLQLRRTTYDPVVRQLREKLEARDNEIERLKREDRALLERFRLWAFNAAQAGISEERLNTPLPETHYKRRAEP